MSSRPDHPPGPALDSLTHSVLGWLERHVEHLARYDSARARQLVAGVLDDLQDVERGGGLRLAWTAHGLDREDVGPVIVLLSPAGAALAYAPSRESGSRAD